MKKKHAHETKELSQDAHKERKFKLVSAKYQTILPLKRAELVDREVQTDADPRILNTVKLLEQYDARNPDSAQQKSVSVPKPCRAKKFGQAGNVFGILTNNTESDDAANAHNGGGAGSIMAGQQCIISTGVDEGRNRIKFFIKGQKMKDGAGDQLAPLCAYKTANGMVRDQGAQTMDIFD